MSNEPQSLANQLGWCITTRDYLEDLNGEVNHIARQYENSVDFLRTHGYFAELLAEISKMHDEFQIKADELVRHINNEHLSYINAQSNAVSGAIQSLLKS
jgi:lipopolysaccharide biosynthesis regulator YciM